MLYLNLLNRIFGSKTGVSREELESYSSSTDQQKKQEIEEKSLSDSFETEAFEGWENINVKKTMQGLDKRMDRNNKVNRVKQTIKWSLISMALVFTVSIVLINFNEQKVLSTATKTISKTVIAVERSTDSIFEKQVEELAVKEVEKQFKQKDVKKTTPLVTSEKVDTVPVLNYESSNKPASINFAPKPIQVLEQPKNLIYKSKKETYLYDLKVVDYSVYRSKPIETERLKLTGTTADKANKDSETEQMVWEKVNIPYVEYLDKTMALFEKGKYKKALVRFKQILNVYPEDVNALFYGGLCYYNLSKNDLALLSFENCYNLEYGNFREEANWLSYLIYREEGNLKKASLLLQKIINEKGYYSQQAQKEKI